MKMKTRTELEAYFQNGKRPSQQEFADLIGSILNKRDDQFFGRWQAGADYRPGDVVIHARALWEMHASEPICSQTAPKEGETWRMLLVQNDGDWILEELAGETPAPIVMYAHEDVSVVGVGTRNPGARLHVVNHEAEGDTLRLSGFRRSAARMTRTGDSAAESTFLGTVLGKARVVWSTDAPDGFGFLRVVPSEDSEDDDRAAGDVSGEALDGVLLFIQPDTDRQVRVGIGTSEPQAMLDVTDGTRGQFLFNPEDKSDPAFSIVNLDPSTDRNYLAGGVGSGQAVFVSDAPGGFVFKKGAEFDEYESVTDINQGRALMTVMGRDRRTWVGIGVEPEKIGLNVNGHVQAFCTYLRAGEDEMTDVRRMDKVLERIGKLTPVRFKWADDTGLGEGGDRFGFTANDIDDVFPEIVREESIAYQNLVPVLVQAINEQQALLREMEQRLDAQQQVDEDQAARIDALESRADDQQQQIDALETRLDTAEQRLDDLEQRAGAAEGRLDDLEPRTGDIEQRVTDVEQRVEALEQ